MNPQQPQIIIIGAGPAGLTLGVLLQLQNIPYQIYDLRPKPTEEDFVQPAGMLNLNEDTGLPAIRACGLYDEFLAFTGECSEDDIVTDKEGNVLHHDHESSGRPEISRHALTRLLLSKIPADRISWEHKLLKATRTGSQYKLDFGPRGTHTADLVIGADGAWSRIRSLLTTVKPHYSGVTFLTLNLPNLDTRYPHLASLVGPGTFAAPGDTNIVMCQRGIYRSGRVYLAVNTAEEQFGRLSGLDQAGPAQAKETLLNNDDNEKRWTMFGNYGPKLKELIARFVEEQSGPMDIKPLYMLPVGKLQWQHQAGVTLIGDAAHLMTPFAGEGVNLAMRDALDLSEAISATWTSVNQKFTPEEFRNALETKVMEAETRLIARAEETAEETWNNLQLFVSPDAATKVAELFAGLGHRSEQI